MRHLPREYRERTTWRRVAAKLDDAAADGDTADIAIALRLAYVGEGRGPDSVRRRPFSLAFQLYSTSGRLIGIASAAC
jgi:hypothetical protein